MTAGFDSVQCFHHIVVIIIIDDGGRLVYACVYAECANVLRTWKHIHINCCNFFGFYIN